MKKQITFLQAANTKSAGQKRLKKSRKEKIQVFDKTDKTILVLLCVILIFFLVIWNYPINKSDILGEYVEWQPNFGYGFINIDNNNFYYNLGTRYHNIDKKVIKEVWRPQEKYAYEFKNNTLSYYDPGYEKVHRPIFSDKIESSSTIEYRIIKIGNFIILLGGDYNRMLFRTKRQNI